MTIGPGHPQRERLLELLADRAVQGLSAPEAAELERLLEIVPGARAEADAFDLAAAAADLAMAGPIEPMPESVRAALRQQAESFAARPSRMNAIDPAVLATIGSADSERFRLSPFLGWLAAAACLAIALVGWFGRGPKSPPTPIDPAAARTALLAAANDVKRWNWTALGELQAANIAGETVWSTSRQEGYMTFSGLPVNNPNADQYQLWIFDPAQSDKTPIDGGVFNVASADGTVVVPMDPKLRVSDAAMFAVTIEKPGGVVVSDRSRLVLIAKPG